MPLTHIKIAELDSIPSVSGPEYLPIVQGGVTKKVVFSTIKNNIISTTQGSLNSAVAILDAEDVAINGLIDDTNAIVAAHTVTLSSHTATLGAHTISINDIIAEDVAINGLIDTLEANRKQALTWTTAGRPTPIAGMFGFNTSTAKFEGYNGTAWVDFA